MIRFNELESDMGALSSMEKDTHIFYKYKLLKLLKGFDVELKFLDGINVDRDIDIYIRQIEEIRIEYAKHQYKEEKINKKVCNQMNEVAQIGLDYIDDITTHRVRKIRDEIGEVFDEVEFKRLDYSEYADRFPYMLESSRKLGFLGKNYFYSNQSPGVKDIVSFKEEKLAIITELEKVGKLSETFEFGEGRLEIVKSFKEILEIEENAVTLREMNA
ncbi:MAG: hypothetical protein N4A47_01095 [Clostridia bacterium]|jgi:hypothetical protein|nr:hypothetical protein [Clostridia bacterium]